MVHRNLYNNNNNDNSLLRSLFVIGSIPREALGLWCKGAIFTWQGSWGCDRLLRWYTILPTFTQLSRKTTEHLDLD